DATVVPLVAESVERLAPRAYGADLDVIVAEELDDARALRLVVFHDEEPLRVRRDVRLQLLERGFELARGRGLDEVRERAVGEPVLPLLFDRQHLNRDVTRPRIELQIVEDGPAEHVRQENVEAYRGRHVLAREGDRLLTAVRDDGFESFASRDPEQDTCVV